MENNIDFEVGMTIIVLALLFVAIFFGVAWLKDRRANDTTEGDVDYDALRTYAHNDLAFTLEAYSPSVITKPPAPSRPLKNFFVEGDYAYSGGLPVYNELATQYNRKNS